jgi:hypothetical protein
VRGGDVAVRPVPIPRDVAERRVRAARCRAALAGSLALVGIAGWILTGVGAVALWAPAIPTVLLAGVLVAGRRAALAQARADIVRFGRVPSQAARDRAAQAAPAKPAALPAPVVITQAELGAMLLSQGVDADQEGDFELVLDAGQADDVGSRPETGDLAVRRAGLGDASGIVHELGTADVAGVRQAAAAEGVGAADAARTPAAETGEPAGADRGWLPAPVPAPAYTLREEAERWEPKPLTEADYEAARAAAARLTAASPEETGRIALPPRVIFGESVLDVDTAITKRRAAR